MKNLAKELQMAVPNEFDLSLLFDDNHYLMNAHLEYFCYNNRYLEGYRLRNNFYYRTGILNRKDETAWSPYLA